MKKQRRIYWFVFLLTLSAFILPKSLFSQYRPWNYNKFHIAIQGGLVSPYDRYGTGHNLKFASYVNKGYNLTVQGVYFYTPNYGAAVNLMLNVHSVNNENLALAYLKTKPAYTNAVASVGSFYLPAFTMGMVFQIPLSEYFAFTASLQAGLQTVVKPAGTVMVTTVFSTIPIRETSDIETKFVIYAKFGAQIRIAKSLHIVADAAYMGSSYDMEYNRNSEIIKETQHIGELMLRLGMAYKFD